MLPHALALLGRVGEKLAFFARQASGDIILYPCPARCSDAEHPDIVFMVGELYSMGLASGSYPLTYKPYHDLYFALKELPWDYDALLDMLRNPRGASAVSTRYGINLYSVTMSAAYKALTLLGLTRASARLYCGSPQRDQSIEYVAEYAVLAARLPNGRRAYDTSIEIVAVAKRRPPKAAEMIESLVHCNREK